MRQLGIIFSLFLMANISLATTIQVDAATDGDSSVAINNLEVYEGMRLWGFLGEVGHRTRIDINAVNAPTPDTFYTLRVEKYLDSTDEFMSRFVHPAGVYVPWDFTRTADTGYNQKGTFVLAVTGFQNGENDENPFVYIVSDLTDPTSPQDFVYANGADTVWIPNPICTPDSFHLDTVYWANSGGQDKYFDTTCSPQDSFETNNDAGYDADFCSDVAMTYIPGAPPKIMLVIRATWRLSDVDRSAIYASSSADLVHWSAWTKITPLGEWLSPGVMVDVVDTTHRYAMYCPILKADIVSGIIDTTTFYKFSANRWDSLWEYNGPVTLTNLGTNRPWHMSVFPIAYDQQLGVVAKRSGGIRLIESIDHGNTWVAANNSLWNTGGGNAPWGPYDATYQTIITDISDRGGYQSLDLVLSGVCDSEGVAHFHTGYAEARLTGVASTPDSTVELLPFDRFLGSPVANDSVVLTIPYADNNDVIAFCDSAIGTAVYDTAKAILTVPCSFDADSVIYYMKGNGGSKRDSFAIQIKTVAGTPRSTDSLYYQTTSDVSFSTSWNRRAAPISHVFSAGQRVLVKWFISHTNPGDVAKVDYVVLKGHRHYDP